MNSVKDHKKRILQRLCGMSGKYSELARLSGCDASTLAKLAQRTKELGPDAVDMRASILISLDDCFLKSDSKCNARDSL